MGQSPMQGDKDKNNWHVWSVYSVPGPVLRALCGAAQQHTAVGTFNSPTVQPRRRRPGRSVPCQAHSEEVVALDLNPTNQPTTSRNYCTLQTPKEGGAMVTPGLWPGQWDLPPSVVLIASMCPLLPQSYTPTVFERLTVNLQIKGKPVHLQIWDTAGGCARLGGGAGWKEGPQMPQAKPHSLPSEPGRPANLQGTGVDQD